MANNRGCDCNCSSENNNSSFIFGLVLGLIIAAIVAVVVYRNNKNKVIVELKEKLTDIFGRFMDKAQDFKNDMSEKQETKIHKKPKTPSSSSKLIVTSEPKIIETEPKVAPVKIKTPKTFVRPKK